MSTLIGFPRVVPLTFKERLDLLSVLGEWERILQRRHRLNIDQSHELFVRHAEVAR